MVASLCGIEDRLAERGECPRFRQAAPGKLVHECTTVTASIAFWPASLQWEGSGADAATIEGFLAGEVAVSSPANEMTGLCTSLTAAHEPYA